MNWQREQYSGRDNLAAMRAADNYNASILKLILRHGPAAADAAALDFGAGIGTFADLLRKQGRVVECLESDRAMADLLRSGGYKVYELAQDIPDGRYDYIYSLNVLEHIADEKQALVDIGGKLKAGGRMLIYVPAFELLYSSMDAKVGHHRRYSRKSLGKVVSSAGLQVLESGYADVMGFFASLAYKVLGSRKGDISEEQVSFFDKRIFPFNRVLDPSLGMIFGKNLYCVCRRAP